MTGCTSEDVTGGAVTDIAGRRSSICRVLPMALIGTAPLDPCEQNKRYDFGGRHEDANLQHGSFVKEAQSGAAD